jgi:low affinity Fe/Cu permease
MYNFSLDTFLCGLQTAPTRIQTAPRAFRIKTWNMPNLGTNSAVNEFIRRKSPIEAYRHMATTKDAKRLANGNGSGNNREWFDALARKAASICGKPTVFLIAVATVVVWAATGPIFNFSDTWQLVINTGTTIVTFLMVFLIQNTQNRDALAIQVKLSELIIAVKGAENHIARAEELTEEELEELRAKQREKTVEAPTAGKQKPQLVN